MTNQNQVTILYAHPWKGSFAQAELNAVKMTLKAQQQPYQVIDLYAEQFDPVMGASDLAVYSQGQYQDPQVGQYIHIIQKTTKLILIFPIWWLNMPAMLKGFFDKVLLANQVVDFGDKGAINHTALTKAMILSTSEFTNDELFNGFHGSVQEIISFPLKSIGAKTIDWHNLGNIIVAQKSVTADYLKQVPKFVQEFLQA